MGNPYLTREELAAGHEIFKARVAAMSDDEMLAFKEQFDQQNIERQKADIERDGKGRFVKGAPSPNPRGRVKDASRPRDFTMTQTAKDLLEVLEQPVTVRKGKNAKQVPAIVAIYDSLVHKAVGGDWQAIKKCLELRERYSDFRGKSLYKLFEAAQDLRISYKNLGQEMPEDVIAFVEMVEARVVEGQFSAA
jgi:hypothetical protein